MALVPVTSTHFGVLLILWVGTAVLGGSIADCTQFTDYNDDGATDAEKYSGGWSGQCYENNQTIQAEINLIYIVMAAIGGSLILYILRMS